MWWRSAVNLYRASNETVHRLKSPPDTFAVVVIKPRKGGDGLRYTLPMSLMPKLGQINATIQDPLARYNAVMAISDLFTVEPEK
jgi:hypothetical protein